jgi:hypothetical protein
MTLFSSVRLQRLVLVFGVSVVTAGLFSYLANDAVALTISPIRLELSADPGQTVNSSFKLFNEQTTKQTYYITFARFETKDETGEPQFVPGKEGLPTWVDAPSSVVAPPQEYYEVPFSITVPRDIDPGGYFAAIFASTNPPQEGGTTDIALQAQVGTLILFRVNGQFSEGETVLEFNIKNKDHWHVSLPIEFYYRFQNSGADRAKPLGDITVRNMFGRISKIVNANPSAGNTLPQSIRRYETAWITSGGEREEKAIGPVAYQPENQSWMQTLKWQWEHFALGRYTANLEVTVNNDSSRSYTGKTSFWVIPWQLLLTVIGGAVVFFGIVIAIAVAIVWLIVRRRK